MEMQTPIAPDGGYGWVIVFCSFFIHAVCNGMTLALGVLVVSWLQAFNAGKSETSWVVSIAVAVMYGIGPFAAGLALKIGYRAMAIVGSIMMAFGMFLSSFASSVFALMLTVGVISGAGFGLTYLSAIAVPAFYFEKKRSMAMGLGTAGTGAGMFLLAPLMNFLVDMYGWRGTMLFLSGICLNVSVVGALMRPLSIPKNPVPTQIIRVANEKSDHAKGTDELLVSTESFATDSGRGSSICEVLIRSNNSLQDDHTPDLAVLGMSNESIKCDKKKKKLSFAAIERPRIFITDTSQAEAAEATELADNDELKKDKNNNKPEDKDRLALKEVDMNSQEPPEDLMMQIKELDKSAMSKKKSYVSKPVKGGPFHHYKSDKNTVTRKHSIGNSQNPHHHHHHHHHHKDKRYNDKLRSNINLMLDYSPYSRPPSTFINLIDLSDDRFLSRLERKKVFGSQERGRNGQIIPRSNSDQKLMGLPSLDVLPPSLELDTEIKDKPMGGSMHQLATTLSSDLDVEASREFRSVIELNTRVNKRVDKSMASIKPRDVYHSGSIYNLMALERTLTQSKRSLYRLSTDPRGPRRHSFHSLIRSGGDLSMYRRKRAPDEPTLCQQLARGIMANLNLLRDATFLLFAVSNFLTNLSLVMPMVFMVDRAISFGISKESAAMLISLNGAGTIFGRVSCSVVADRSWMNRLLAYITTLALAGLATSASPLCGHSIILHGLYAFSFGLLTGNYGALCACVLVDLKGLDSVGQSYGLLLFFMGVSTLMGTPLGGLVYDISGDYQVPFILHGAFITLSGLILIPLLLKQSKCRQK